MQNRLTRSVMGGRPPSRALVIVAVPWAMAILGLAGCASLPSMGMRAGSESSDWSAVMRLGTGRSVRVEDTAHNVVAGQIVRADGDEITIAAGPSPRTVLRASVQRLFLVERLTATKAKRGWLIGTVAGGLVGAFAKSNRVPWALFMSAGWGAFGAGIGASDGFFDRKESLVYQAQLATSANPITQLANIGLQPTTAHETMRPSRLKPPR